MMYDATANLVDVTYSGALGVAVRTETTTPIYCQIGSVDRREFFAAYDSGLKPEFRVTTDPVNYAGQSIIDLETAEGVIRCDIYRTYRKAADALELWCVRKNPDAVQVFTLWTAGKRVTLCGGYLTGSNSNERTTTGKVATDTVTLVLPQTFQAFAGGTPVAYVSAKMYALMSPTDQAKHFTIDSSSFFVVGEINPGLLISPEDYDGVLSYDDYLIATADIPEDAKYQQINSIWDTYRVQSVSLKNTGKPDTEYLEVIGK